MACLCWLGPRPTSSGLSILRGVVPLLLRIVGLLLSATLTWVTVHLGGGVAQRWAYFFHVDLKDASVLALAGLETALL